MRATASGSQLWFSGRYHGEVDVLNAATGALALAPVSWELELHQAVPNGVKGQWGLVVRRPALDVPEPLAHL